MNYKQAIEFIKQRRALDLMRGEQFYFDALKTYSELKNADTEYRKATLSSIKSGDNALANAKKTQLDALIKSLGLWNSVHPAPHCAKCNDEGFSDGKICDCVKALTVGDDLIGLPLHHFEDVDLKLFENRNADLFFTTLNNLNIVFNKKFPDTKKRIFSLIGNSGTGKTYLAACCTHAVLERGYSAVFLTAFNIISRAMKYHTTFDGTGEQYLQPLLDCDLLVIDDLGTEPIYRNVTLEYLYLIINERQLKGKHTLITSNLNIDQIKSRYGERIASRILDQKTCFIAEFNFKDVRKIDI